MGQVQANLFHGSKFNDHTVPQNVGTGELVAARKKRLEEEKASSVYTTTNKLYFGKSAEQAKEIFETTGGCLVFSGNQVIVFMCPHLCILLVKKMNRARSLLLRKV